MMKELLYRDIYDIAADQTSLNGVMLRGRLRKLSLEYAQNILLENTSDRDNGIRFALLAGESSTHIKSYLHSLADDIHIKLIQEKVPNPVLSKLKINQEERYTL